MSLPAVESANVVGFYPALVPFLGGDVIASLLLSQIIYWYSPDAGGKSRLRVCKQGQWWLAKSATDWAMEIGVTPKQARRALDVLEGRGIVVSQVMRFNGAPTTHCRLTAVNGSKKPFHAEDLICLFGHSHLTSQEFPFAPQGKFITETTTKTTTGNSKTATPFSGGKTGNEDMPKLIGSSDAILASLKEKKGKVVQKSNTKSSAISLWRELVPKHHPELGMIPAFTMSQIGQLGHLAKALGNNTDAVLSFCLSNWIAFTKHASEEAGLVKTPLAPHIGFILKHAASAISFWTQNAINCKPMKGPVKSQPVSVKPTPVEAPQKEVASLEDILKWKSMDDKG